MSRFRMTAKFRAGWACILADGEAARAERVERRKRASDGEVATRLRLHHIIASRICDRWKAAGFTTARLVDGLPRPERPHAATWLDGVFARCACGRVCYQAPPPAMCPGRSPFDLILRALDQSVPFGLRDGLPTAGVPAELGDVVVKLARATCRPIVTREEREAA